MPDKSRFDVIDPLLALPRPAKRAIVLALDVFLCIATTWLAFYLRLDEWIRLTALTPWRADWAAMLSVAVAIPLFITQGFYRVIFRYAGSFALSMSLRTFVFYGLVYAGLITVIGIPGIPRSVGLIQPLLLLVAVGTSRLVAHYWLGGVYQRILKRASLPRALIYGAGQAGRQLARAMIQSQDMRVVGFLDDDARLQGQVMHGLKIFAPDDLDALIRARGIGHVLLAMPSLPRHRRNEILTQFQQLKVAVRSLPTVEELIHGKVTLLDLRELDIEDLLGRDPVPPDPTLLSKRIQGKTVLVTGAGGSIGAELCRQILLAKPKTLVLVDTSEFALYQIHADLIERNSLRSTEDHESGKTDHPVKLVAVLASVQDAHAMQDLMLAHQPQTVYHAAAYKHVPIVEDNPIQGIRNNTFGTLVAAQAAVAAGVEDFVLVSTDKAVRPTNVMGASKRLAEMVLQAMANEHPRTRFSVVRFGNVLGSSGSVVPKFRQQIRHGGPLTLTDPDVTRYFMTIPEAAQLVIQASAMAQGGEVFVLDMGEPIRILDLARRMIELSGLTVRDAANPNGDIAIDIVGLRPGEKRYEELLIGDNALPTSHPRIMQAFEAFMDWPALEAELATLQTAMQRKDLSELYVLLGRLVTDYQRSPTEVTD